MKRHDDRTAGQERRGFIGLAGAMVLFPLALGGTASAGSVGGAQGLGFAAVERVTMDEMAATRAREGGGNHFQSAQSIQNMQAVVTDTHISVVNGDMVSGNIRFDANAMGNYSGTGIFSAVTGNGNAINNAVGISVFISAD
ncbi:hypothetical protein [Halomonas campaniensis]|uniref:hypothetical protein n=1 Tax=Halomonas campaniensis TaxID=213554 RepID=UPI003970B5F5